MTTTTMRWRFLAVILTLSCLSIAAQAQTTTLLFAVTNSQGYVVLASTAGVTGPGQPVSNGIGPPSGAENGVLYVGSECMRVLQAPPSGSHLVLVSRGWRETGAGTYAAGATVTISNTSLPPPNGFPVPIFASRRPLPAHGPAPAAVPPQQNYDRAIAKRVLVLAGSCFLILILISISLRHGPPVKRKYVFIALGIVGVGILIYEALPLLALLWVLLHVQH